MKKNNLTHILLIVLSIMIFQSCSDTEKSSNSIEPTKVELRNENGKYQLYCNNEPFYIRGGGLEFGRISTLKKHGGNSFRTWRVDNGKVSGKEVLDAALENGLMVCMGIEVARERHGFDYNDTIAVNKQFEQIKKDVEDLKDHPALLMWGIGNELNLRYKNPKVWDAVNEIAAMIHDIDSNHPTTTMLAGAGKDEIKEIMERCPELDLLSFQLYGKIVELPKYIKESNYKGAYMVTEWGATGHWEVDKTSWGRPIEQNSHIKAQAYKQRYNDVIVSDSNKCIGSYVFLWGQKQERTPTWYGVFLENGDKTESVDIMQYVWTGDWPENRSPKMISLTIDGKEASESIVLNPGIKYQAKTLVEDPENDKLTYKWVILREVETAKQSDGGDFEEKPEIVFELNGMDTSDEIQFDVKEKGEYRLFVYASDGNGSSATANIPILIK